MRYHKSRTECYQVQKRKKIRQIILSLVLITIIGIGGTFAYLTDTTKTLTNTFFPAKVTVEVLEEFNEEKKDNFKKNITVKNTGNIEAYIRVKLLSYRVNDQGERIGGKAPIPSFDPGTNWVEHNSFYYYTLPVAPKKFPKEFLIGESGIKLTDYDDADGGKQVIEVMAEGIQSMPKDAVKEAWGQDIFDLLGGGES